MPLDANSASSMRGLTHIVTKALSAQQMGQSVETGTDRMWLETPFGERVELRLEGLLERVRRLLEDNRIWVLALAHAYERQSRRFVAPPRG